MNNIQRADVTLLHGLMDDEITFRQAQVVPYLIAPIAWILLVTLVLFIMAIFWDHAFYRMRETDEVYPRSRPEVLPYLRLILRVYRPSAKA
jgi:hypothetical protein